MKSVNDKNQQLFRNCSYCGIPIILRKKTWNWIPYEISGQKHYRCVRKNKDGQLPFD